MFSFSVTPICKRTWIFHFQTISNLNSVRYNDTWPQITVNFWRSKFPNHKLIRLNIFKKLFWIDCIKISPEFVPWLVDLCELKQRLSKLAPCLEFGTSRLVKKPRHGAYNAFLRERNFNRIYLGSWQKSYALTKLYSDRELNMKRQEFEYWRQYSIFSFRHG